MLTVASAANAQVTISGTTSGCFFQGPIGAQCATGSSNASVGNLTFTGGSFSVTMGPGGDFDLDDSNDNLGRFSLSNADFNFNPPGSNNTWGFRLFIAITSPLTTPGGTTFLGTFDGDLNVNDDDDELDIEFGRLQLEQATWAESHRIDQVARTRLGMAFPKTEDIVVVQP